MQAHIEVVRSAKPPIAVTAGSAAVAGRVVYIGRPFTKWAEIRRNLADRNLDISEDCDPQDSACSDALARANLVIIGAVEWPREAHEVCAEVRRKLRSVPILLLTDAGDTVGRILGLENGADAWAAADADARIALAQIRALLRRETNPDIGDGGAPSTLRVGNFLLNPASRQVVIDRLRINLTALEYALLWNLLQRAGQAISRADLAGMVGYGASKAGGRAIDMLVRRLRIRIGVSHAHHIRSVRAFGYMLCTDAAMDSAINVAAVGL